MSVPGRPAAHNLGLHGPNCGLLEDVVASDFELLSYLAFKVLLVERPLLQELHGEPIGKKEGFWASNTTSNAENFRCSSRRWARRRLPKGQSQQTQALHGRPAAHNLGLLCLNKWGPGECHFGF